MRRAFGDCDHAARVREVDQGGRDEDHEAEERRHEYRFVAVRVNAPDGQREGRVNGRSPSPERMLPA